MDEPLCACHGAPMFWHTDKRLRAGGAWRCRVRLQEAQRRWNKSPQGRATKYRADRAWERTTRGQSLRRQARLRAANARRTQRITEIEKELRHT